MIIKPRQCGLCKNHIATSKVKFTVRTYSLCIGLNETYLCPPHNFVVWPASGMVRYKDLVFHPFVRSHQGAVLLKALRGGIIVLWTHLNCTDSYKYGDDPKYWAEVFEHTLYIQIILLRVCAIFCSAVSNN